MIKFNGSYYHKLFRLKLVSAYDNHNMDVYCEHWSPTQDGLICYYSCHTDEKFLSKDWTLTEVEEL